MNGSVFYTLAKYSSRFLGSNTLEWAQKAVAENEELLMETTIDEFTHSDRFGSGNITFVDDNDEKIKIFKGAVEERNLIALSLALEQRVRQYIWIFISGPLLFLFSIVLSLCLQTALPLTIDDLGVYLDIFGALVISRSLFRTPEEIETDSKSSAVTIPDEIPVKRLITAVRTADGIIGAGLLVVGFSLILSNSIGILLSIIALVIVLIVWYFSR